MGSSSSLLSSILYQPPPCSYVHAKKHIIWLRTKTEANVPSFFIDRHSKTTVLFSHGNAEDLGMIYEWFCEFTREAQVNLLAYDYEGYGKASGSPSEQGCYEDVEAAWTFLTEVLHQKPENIILYGRSLGSGPSCYLAEKLSLQGIRIGGLILQSPLMSVFRVAFNFRFTLPGDMFPNVDRIANVTCPVFLIHGTRDEVVPFWNGEGLFFATPVKYRAKPFWIDGAGHNNLETLTREEGLFFAQIIEFLIDWVPGYSFKGKKSRDDDSYTVSSGMSGNSLITAGRLGAAR